MCTTKGFDELDTDMHFHKTESIIIEKAATKQK